MDLDPPGLLSITQRWLAEWDHSNIFRTSLNIISKINYVSTGKTGKIGLRSEILTHHYAGPSSKWVAMIAEDHILLCYADNDIAPDNTKKLYAGDPDFFDKLKEHLISI